MLDAGATLVYCRPPIETILDFSNHEVKEYDSPEHLKELQLNGLQVIHRYDALFESLPHYRYDWTKGDFRREIGEILAKMGVKESDRSF